MGIKPTLLNSKLTLMMQVMLLTHCNFLEDLRTDKQIRLIIGTTLPKMHYTLVDGKYRLYLNFYFKNVKNCLLEIFSMILHEIKKN